MEQAKASAAAPENDDVFRYQRVWVPEGFLAQSVGEETLLLNLDTEHDFGLDPVGTDRWQALATTASLGRTFDALAARDDVAPTPLRRDLAAPVDDLVASGLLLEDS